jgi:predicted Zn-dependent protease with MMP-like domain
MNQHKIIMNFTAPPTAEDIETMAKELLASLPDEIQGNCKELTLRIEDFPDDVLQSELNLEDPYELIALYRSGKEIAPGVVKKVANDDDVLMIFRRPLLDLWCETQDDLTFLLREVMIEELARNFEFSEDEIEEMTARFNQGF